LHFAEQRRQNYRVIIYNQDSPALDITHVNGSGPGYQLLFIKQPGAGYRLQYGGKQVSAPNYDIAPLRELLRQGYQTTLATLGSEVELKADDEQWNPLIMLNSSVFLGLMIGLMVLVLGWSLYKVGKRVNEIDR
jgi:hypothetical protein